MARFVFIVQGTGRGHLSQAVAMQEILEAEGHEIMAVFTGGRPGLDLPGYYLEAFGEKLTVFVSPWFLSLPNKKGIYIGRTLISNSLRSPGYIACVQKIRKQLEELHPDVVINFYELIGALAMRRLPADIRRIGVGHHFLLHLDNYSCNTRNKLQKLLLRSHTRIIQKSCDRILALSFRKGTGAGKVSLVPPLLRARFRNNVWTAGTSYLVYLLQEGYISDLLRLVREDPQFSCDVFSSLPVESKVPEGIQLHPFSEDAFREKMLTCRALLSTAGFDALAEAASMGVPAGVVPSQNHFEQECNATDLERSGLGVRLSEFSRNELLRIKECPNSEYREWLNEAPKLVLKEILG